MVSWLAALPQQLTLPAIYLMIAWLAVMISLPTLQVRWGERAQVWCINAGVLLQASTVVAILIPAWGVGPSLLVVATVAVLAWSAEFVGLHTGFPFGRYAYTDRLQPQLGKVPVQIPLAWLMMLPPAWAVGGAISGSHQGVLFILASALAFTAWDLFLDPQMVAWHLWTWSGPDGEPQQGAGFFGVPWTNYAGWFAVSALMTWAVIRIMPSADTPWAALSLIYALTWLMESVGQIVIWPLYGPAVAGAVGMGLCLVGAIII